MINVDSYHTQKGVYTTNQIPTRTERNAWHHGNVMKMKNETKLMVKQTETLTIATYKIPVIPYQISVTTYQCLRQPSTHTNIPEYDKLTKGMFSPFLSKTLVLMNSVEVLSTKARALTSTYNKTS